MNNEKYIQFAKPDKMLLAELTIKAKGRMRTMAQMSAGCGVNTSTLSRIANGKISKPLTIEVLQSIYDNRDADADFPFEMFLKANGMITEENVERFEKRWWGLDDKKQRRENCRRQVKNIIVTALMARGIVVQKIPNSFECRRNNSRYGIELPFDFNFYIEKAKTPLWYFKIIDAVDPLEGISKAIHVTSKFFLLDSWNEKELFANTKTTFIFTDKTVYASVVMQYRYAPITAAFSAMWIDLDNEQIVEEESIPSEKKISSVLSWPEIENEGFIASWESDEDYDEYE